MAAWRMDRCGWEESYHLCVAPGTDAVEQRHGPGHLPQPQDPLCCISKLFSLGPGLLRGNSSKPTF